MPSSFQAPTDEFDFKVTKFQSFGCKFEIEFLKRFFLEQNISKAYNQKLVSETLGHVGTWQDNSLI